MTPSTVPATPLVDVVGLRVELDRLRVDIVDEVSFTILPGQVLALVGESGSGKTTVGGTLLGHCRRGARVSAGEVRVDGRDMASLDEREKRRLRGSVVSYVPQDPDASLNPALRIGSQLDETVKAHRPSESAATRIQRIRTTLEQVSLPIDTAFLHRYPHQLSGGQLQRIAIAMAFVNQPRLIVCDEPTTGLDVTTQAQVLETLRALCQAQQVAMLYVTHDLAVVAELADVVAVIYAGRIVEMGPCEGVFATPRHPYTRRLLAAVPNIDGKRVITGIKGTAPLPGRRPTGCFFHPRCEFASVECRQTFPATQELGIGHTVRCYHLDGVSQGDVDGVARAHKASAISGLALSVRGLNARHGSRPTLSGIDLDLNQNECLALVGESGSGKTTLARCIAGLHSDYTGMISMGDVALPRQARQRPLEMRKDIQYIFQNPYRSLNPRQTVGQTVARQLTLLRVGSKRDINKLVLTCLERVALPESVANRFPDQLSGGERQRVAIARALAAEPRVLLCDEITSALDVSVQASIVNLLDRLRVDVGVAILFITHNLALTPTVAERVAVMSEGRIVEVGPITSVMSSPSHVYTRQLLANTPRIDTPRVISATQG